MNRNYQSGVRFEREVIKEYELDGWLALRTAGSHGPFDVIGVHPGITVDFVQCKVTKSEALAARLCADFERNPPLPPGPYRQIMVVKVPRKGRKTIIIERAK